MPVISKPKTRSTMASGRSSMGRVFCVTGMQPQSLHQEPSTTPTLIGSEYASTNLIGHSDSDSNTSGYLSSSSFESSGEEKRLVLNEQKVFSVWTKWGERVQVPKSSTPKQGSEYVAYKKLAKRVNLSSDSGKSMLSIKKNFNEQSKKHGISKNNENEAMDSFWDIKTPKVQRSNSENDVTKSDKCADDLWKRKSVQVPVTHDAGQEITTPIVSKKSQDWKRRPFLTLSDSQLDHRLKGENVTNHSAKNRTSVNNPTYSALPRYRVKMDADPVVSKNSLAQRISKSCADFADTGVPVDESMSEFLSNVDRENLASFLNFYDRMTNTSAYEKAKKNPNNYEAVYY